MESLSGGVLFHASPVARKIDERVGIVVGLRCRGSRMRVGNVVATEVITTIAGVLHVGGDVVIGVLVQRLPDGCVAVQKGKLVPLRFLDEDRLVLFAAAVFLDLEEFLDLLSDEGELGVDSRRIPASPIVAAEELDLLIHHRLSELGVGEEHRRLERLVLRVDRLFILRAEIEWFGGRLQGNHWVPHSSSSCPGLAVDELVTHAELRLSKHLLSDAIVVILTVSDNVSKLMG